MSFGGFDPPPPKPVGTLPIVLQRLVSLGGFDPPPPTLFGMQPLHLNDSFDMCPFAKCFSIAHIRHIHFFDVSIFQNIIGLFRSTVLRVMSPTRFLCATMMGLSLGGFDPPPLTLRLSVRSHYATMTRLICAPFIFYKTFPSHISVTSIFLMCPSSYNIIGLFRSTVLQVMSLTRFLCATMMGCHWVVSIHLP